MRPWDTTIILDPKNKIRNPSIGGGAPRVNHLFKGNSYSNQLT
jgi:hypothetical protein